MLPGNNNRLDQAFGVTPDGVRIEILEDKSQSMPIRHEHVHFSLHVKDLQAFAKKIQAVGFQLDERIWKNDAGAALTYNTDPWGTRIELVQRPPS